MLPGIAAQAGLSLPPSYSLLPLPLLILRQSHSADERSDDSTLRFCGRLFVYGYGWDHGVWGVLVLIVLFVIVHVYMM